MKEKNKGITWFNFFYKMFRIPDNNTPTEVWHPEDTFIIRWRLLMFLITSYYSFVVPLRIGFYRQVNIVQLEKN